MPLQANVEEVPSQDEEEMYERLLDQTAQPAATRSTSKSSETTSAPPRKVTPDVVIEVEGTQEARERGHVVIVIENADPDLEVQIVVRTKRAGLAAVGLNCCWFDFYWAEIQVTWVSEGWGWISCSKEKDM